MFEKLVVSSKQRRARTTGKFFLMTATLYAVAIAVALAVSVLTSDPRLADTVEITRVSPLPLMIGASRRPPGLENRSSATPRPDYRNVETLEKLLSHKPGPPVIPMVDPGPVDFNSGPSYGLLGAGSNLGVIGGAQNVEPAPKPDTPKPRPVAQTSSVDNTPVRVISQVLQGKAIERPIPVYPPLAQQIHLQGNVSVEVIISPDGRVETARVVGGHPMLAASAVEAARRWRFQPTLLNNVPVRVTGVIVFVFKLSE
ncbi:MAG TPA: energy transducer TonB [Blastocatellia bacterium]|nr:energy transducer TonB [Blastocatellia bacterium]